MTRISVLIPSRNEKYLTPTVEECFTKAAGEVEVVVVLEGYKPDDWSSVQSKHVRLHTIYHNEPRGMRPSLNEAAGSAISRGAKYLLKLDAHCLLDEGYDTKLLADIEPDWVVVPRRLRLDAENWKVRDDNRPPIDYHYLSFPDNVNDFGGPGLNGKVWVDRARERYGKPEFDIDEELSSQGSCWFMESAYYRRLELMDTESYGPFWNEAQEILLKCWLSGGKGIVNKKTFYAHLHKGSNYKGADGKGGRGYNLPKEWLNTGARFTKKWLFNEAWAKQTRPFNWLIQHFWPVPTWPENWESLVYDGPNKSKIALPAQAKEVIDVTNGERLAETPSLRIISAHYGPTGTELDVCDLLRTKVVNDSLDLNVTNGELQVGNPFRGIKKQLTVTYAYNGQPPTTITKDEREWLIIGQSARWVKGAAADPVVEISLPEYTRERVEALFPERSAASLNDFLIRKFQIPSHRLRGPMPIEVPSFHRDDLAQLFAELGMNRGAEIGVAEGKYSEVLCKANPDLQLLCVDPWHSYKGNPQSKTKAKDEFAYNEAKRRLDGYKATLDMRLSEDAVRDVPDGSLDFVYIDGHHGFDYVMQDLIEWSKRVRSGGIIAGDDFYYLDPKRWGAGPVEAVQAYTQAHAINPWFICDAHKSIDYFWVRP